MQEILGEREKEFLMHVRAQIISGSISGVGIKVLGKEESEKYQLISGELLSVVCYELAAYP